MRITAIEIFSATISLCLSAVALASTSGTETPIISAGEFLSGEFDFRPVRAKCLVKDAFRDEINPDYAYLTLLWDNRIVYAAVPAKPLTDDDIAALIGANIVATGQPLPHLYDQREKLGRNLQISNPEAIQVTERATEDPFDVPDISSLYGLGPGDLVNIGRRRFRGRVLAVWDRTTVLLSGVGKFNMPETVTAKLVNTPAPAVGEEIETSGFPETDIYHYTLVRARWRGISAATNLPPASIDITAKGMTTDETGRTRYRYEMHGKVVKMRGRVHSVHDAGGRILLEDGGLIVPVDVSATEDATLNLSRGCVVEATGVCVMEIENWQMDEFRLPADQGLLPRRAHTRRHSYRRKTSMVDGCAARLGHRHPSRRACCDSRLEYRIAPRRHTQRPRALPGADRTRRISLSEDRRGEPNRGRRHRLPQASAQDVKRTDPLLWYNIDRCATSHERCSEYWGWPQALAFSC